jgi:hypothetical protein
VASGPPTRQASSPPSATLASAQGTHSSTPGGKIKQVEPAHSSPSLQGPNQQSGKEHPLGQAVNEESQPASSKQEDVLRAKLRKARRAASDPQPPSEEANDFLVALQDEINGGQSPSLPQSSSSRLLHQSSPPEAAASSTDVSPSLVILVPSFPQSPPSMNNEELEVVLQDTQTYISARQEWRARCVLADRCTFPACEDWHGSPVAVPGLLPGHSCLAQVCPLAVNCLDPGQSSKPVGLAELKRDVEPAPTTILRPVSDMHKWPRWQERHRWLGTGPAGLWDEEGQAMEHAWGWIGRGSERWTARRVTLRGRPLLYGQRGTDKVCQ